MRKFGRPYLVVLTCTLRQQSPGARHTDMSLRRALTGTSHTWPPLHSSLPVTEGSLHHHLSYDMTHLWAFGYPSKETAQQSSWRGGRSDPQIPWGRTTRIHCVASMWQFEVGRNNTGCVWSKGHHADPRAVVKGKLTRKTHSRTIRKWNAEQNTAINYAGKSQLHSHASSMHKLVSPRKGPITN